MYACFLISRSSITKNEEEFNEIITAYNDSKIIYTKMLMEMIDKCYNSITNDDAYRVFFIGI